VKPVVYDAAVLVAADRNNRSVWAEHRVRLEASLAPMIPAPVVAQVSRAPSQANLGRLLRGCEVVAFDETDAQTVGRLLAASGTSVVIDAALVALAARRGADVQTGDGDDIRRLVAASGAPIDVHEI
jgi:hypothetical protein